MTGYNHAVSGHVQCPIELQTKVSQSQIKPLLGPKDTQKEPTEALRIYANQTDVPILRLHTVGLTPV